MAADVRVLSDDAGGAGGLLKAALPTIPGLNQLPGIKKTGGGLPDLEVRRSDVRIERDAVSAYAAVCGFPRKDVVPVTYLHMVGFPLHMAIMSDQSFPFPSIGTVHLENRIVSHRPVAIGESVSATANARNLRTHSKGRAFDMCVTVESGGEIVWESTSTYLRLGKGDKENGEKGTEFATVPGGAAVWRLGSDLGRRYAAVSGDSNPIHLYPLTAKAFGFPRHIAHGMWTKARAVASIENRLPDAVQIEVGFKKPIFLPARVSFGARQTANGFDFTVNNPTSGVPHLMGRTTSL